MIVRMLLSGVLGAFIGFFTNFIAVRMLFYPRRRIFGIQGLLPKYKQNFAEKAAGFSFQFIRWYDVLDEIARKRALSSVARKMKSGILRRYLTLIIALEIEFMLRNAHVKKHIAREINGLTPHARSFLAERIANTNVDALSSIVLKNASKEIRFIQLLGGIFGFIIGVLQPLISRFSCG